MYDFQVFGYYAAAIGRNFFPSTNEFASTDVSLRDVRRRLSDAASRAPSVLGAYLDHHGRRAGTAFDPDLMSVGTLSIAVLPGYAVIGSAAPLLVLAGQPATRVSAGVELGGVSVYLSEIAPPGRRAAG